jgi:5-formyltetrahydrofolate cyclo-ligase
MTDSDIDEAKQAIRRRVWGVLERDGAAPLGVHGHIPAFVGADRAAARLAELPAWQDATVLKSNPDRAQLPVRVQALQAGKVLYMAVPKLASVKPFYLLDPAALTAPFDTAATGLGAPGAAELVGLDDMQPVALIVCGSVAVNRRGVRIGKGAGYSDIEVALLTEAGLIGPETTIVTTVHQLQVLVEELPETAHDFSVDVIVTPDEVITCKPARRPRGVLPDHLGREQVRNIPAVSSYYRRT